MLSAPTPPRPDLVVCDLAGTTVRDGGEVPAAFEAALREAGLRYDPAEVRGWRGASKREVVARLWIARTREGRRERVYRRFRAPAGESVRCGAPLASRVPRPSRRLKADGIGVAVTTGFDREVVEPFSPA
jgi:phosphoglycolate phosphatase-like HAD superfamily hydrolase